MNLPRLLPWVSVLVLALTRVTSAATPALSVPPWYSDNAVLALDVPFDTRRQVTQITGFTDEVKGLVCAFSTEPGSWLPVTRRERQEASAKPVAWEISLRDASRASEKALVSGAPFDVTFALVRKPRGAEPSRDVLHKASNLAVGPVWAVVVDPTQDKHELPALTMSAKDWVRIFSFEGGLSPSHSSGWMSAVEADRSKLANFVGLPRAFANAIASYANTPIGIVLVPRPWVPSDLPSGQAIADWVPDERDQNHPALRSALEAAVQANDGTNSGSRVRFSALNTRNKANLQNLKRQGIVAIPEPGTQVLWKQVHPGHQDFLPFRVTGLIR